MLFLNKRDLFEEKIKTVDPKKWFPDYTGGCNYDAVRGLASAPTDLTAPCARRILLARPRAACSHTLRTRARRCTGGGLLQECFPVACQGRQVCLRARHVRH